MEVLTAEEMRNVDRRAIEELGIPGILLMESAGREVAAALFENYPHLASESVVVVCGKGNNGGDGLVAARHLQRWGVATRVLLLATAGDLRGDAAVNLGAARASGVEIVEAPDDGAWCKARTMLDGAFLMVDAILGTGASGGARGIAATAIQDLNRRPGQRVAIDLPSGLDADTHVVPGIAVSATRTYTLCRPKLALVLEPASRLAGPWRVLPIGIPHAAVEREGARVEWLEASALAGLVTPRDRDSHKGTYGHLMGVAGSRDKSGAAVLLARAALRAGVGLVTVATAASCRDRVSAAQAELMTEALPETSNGHVSRDALQSALGLLRTRDALALGPGLGTGESTRDLVVGLIEQRTVPAVVDADGLTVLAPQLATLRERGAAPLVLTPHPGEAARLLGIATAAVQEDRLGACRELAARTGATVVLKGHRSMITAPDGRASVNSTGNPGMATAGTGDVLTGVVGALLAQGRSAWEAARLAVYVHGHAGDMAASGSGEQGLIASDIIDALPGAFTDLSTASRRLPW